MDSDPPRVRRNTHGHRLPMTPAYALKEFGHKLTPFEQKEIMEYPEIWFLGLEAKKTEGVPGAAQNAGNGCGLNKKRCGFMEMTRSQSHRLR